MSELDDFLRISSDTGDLKLESPPLDWLNVTANVSIGCFTELLSGDRDLDELDRCVRVVFSFLTLSRVRIFGFPFEFVWPWQSDVAALTGNASLPALPALSAVAPSAAMHTAEEAVHDDGLYLYAYDLVWVFVLLGLCSLLCGAGFNDRFFTDADGVLFRNGVPYRRVKTELAQNP